MKIRLVVIELGIITMVLENNDERKSLGINRIYKKVKVLRPIQMKCGRYVVDTVFFCAIYTFCT